jgi:hypothetical protein
MTSLFVRDGYVVDSSQTDLRLCSPDQTVSTESGIPIRANQPHVEKTGHVRRPEDLVAVEVRGAKHRPHLGILLV